jgi:hypothetical protein
MAKLALEYATEDKEKPLKRGFFFCSLCAPLKLAFASTRLFRRLGGFLKCLHFVPSRYPLIITSKDRTYLNRFCLSIVYALIIASDWEEGGRVWVTSSGRIMDGGDGHGKGEGITTASLQAQLVRNMNRTSKYFI